MPTATQPTAKQLMALADSFPWDEWNQQLAPELEQIYRDLVVTTGKKAAGEYDVKFDQDDPFLQAHMQKYLGSRIAQLSETSKTDVIRVMTKSLEDADNLSPAELQDRILGAVREKFESYEGYRALRIARSESAIAYNTGNVLGARAAGFSYVEVVDGTDDEECAAANGSIWTLEYALENPIAHPNCVRAFFPVEAPAAD